MAASTQTTMAAPDYLQGIEEQAILAAYQKTERHGLESGRLCYDYRAKYGEQGSRTGGGLAQLLRKLNIKEGKAYYWVAAYEESIGERAKPVASTNTAPAVEDDPELAAMFAPPTAEELTAPQFVSEPIEAPTSEAPTMEILPPESKESDLTRLRHLFKGTGLDLKKSDHGSKYVLDNLTAAQVREIATVLVTE